jgi:endo-1,4-beta-xylanase
MGAAVDFAAIQNDANYRSVVTREFDILVPENAWKFQFVHPTRDRYDFSEVDALMAFAKANNMQMRGHPLAWHHLIPSWVEEGNFTRDQWMAILREHIQTLMGRYRGEIPIWDVVNEAINRDGSLRDTIWLRHIGPEYIDLAFRWAHEADPQARLFYCDYGTEQVGQKSNAVYDLLRGLLQRGVPVNGVGFQAHLGLSCAPKLESLAKNFQRLGELGLEVQFTELEVKVQDGTGSWEDRLAAQAKVYAGLLQTCLQAKNCTAFTTWGFTDRYSWIAGLTGQLDAPLIFDESYRPKPAYYALQKVLNSEF